MENDQSIPIDSLGVLEDGTPGLAQVYENQGGGGGEQQQEQEPPAVLDHGPNNDDIDNDNDKLLTTFDDMESDKDMQATPLVDDTNMDPLPTQEFNPEDHPEPLALPKEAAAPPIKKRGPKKGSKIQSYKQSEWKALCRKYEYGLKIKWKTQIEFLRSPESNPFTVNNARAFSGHWNKFKNGQHSGLHVNRVREKPYKEMEAKLINYLDLRARLYVRDRCGLSYAGLREKLLQWASEMKGMQDFTASAGWIAKVLKRNNKEVIFEQPLLDDYYEYKAKLNNNGGGAQGTAATGMDDNDGTASCLKSFAETQTVLNEIELFIQDESKRRKAAEFDHMTHQVQQELKTISESLRRLSNIRPTVAATAAAPKPQTQPNPTDAFMAHMIL